MNAHTKPEPGTALTIPDATSLSALFTKGEGLSTMLSELERAARAEAKSLDATTRKGRDALKSLAYKVSQSKNELDRQGLALTEEARKQIDAVNAGRKQAKDRLDALRDEIKKPAIDWEAAEEIRIAKHKTALDAFDPGRVDAMSAADLIRSVVAEVEQIDTGESWEEFQPIAVAAKENALAKFSADLATAEQREAEQAELARLRAAEEERQRQADEKRAAEEEAVRKAEEAKAAADALKERAERARDYITEVGEGRIGGNIQPFGILVYELEAKLPPLVDELGEHAEDLHRLRLSTLEAVKAMMEEQRVADRAADAERAKKAAEEAAELAAQAERDRIAAEAKDREDAERKRAADQAHRERIIKEIAEALMPIPRENIPQALLDGRVPHVKVLI